MTVRVCPQCKRTLPPGSHPQRKRHVECARAHQLDYLRTYSRKGPRVRGAADTRLVVSGDMKTAEIEAAIAHNLALIRRQRQLEVAAWTQPPPSQPPRRSRP